MELDNILKDYLEEKEVKKKETLTEEQMLSITSLKNKSKDYDEDMEDEDEEDDYDNEEDEEDDEEYDEDEDEDYQEIDIEVISDMEKIKIVCDILNHIENDYPGLEKAITILQDIVEDINY